MMRQIWTVRGLIIETQSPGGGIDRLFWSRASLQSVGVYSMADLSTEANNHGATKIEVLLAVGPEWTTTNHSA